MKLYTKFSTQRVMRAINKRNLESTANRKVKVSIDILELTCKIRVQGANTHQFLQFIEGCAFLKSVILSCSYNISATSSGILFQRISRYMVNESFAI